MVHVEVKFDKEAHRKKLQRIRELGRQIVITQALGAVAALYDVYPVGPEEPHARDGTPHTRDTFQVFVDGDLIAEKGQFWTSDALGTNATEDSFSVAFRAAGAAFFLEWGCFTDKSKQILTKRGYVAFAELREGEEVFTHLGRWRKVTKKHTFNSKTPLPIVSLKTEKGSKVSVTANHAFMTPNGFVDACNLKLGDQIQSVHNDLPHFHWKNFSETIGKFGGIKVIVICESCGKESEIYKSELKYGRGKHCSITCARKGNQNVLGHRWTRTKEANDKMRGQNNPMFRKRKGEYYSAIGWREDLGHKVRSTWEANYARTLIAQGIVYQYEPVSFNLSVGTYTPDFKVFHPVDGEYFVEVKGYMDDASIKKLREFALLYPQTKLVVIGPVEYKVLTEKWKSRIPLWEIGRVSRRGNEIKFQWDTISEIRFVRVNLPPWMCQCGCGVQNGTTKKHPRKYIHGHNGKSVYRCYDLTVQEDHSYTLEHLVCHNTVFMDPQPLIRPMIKQARAEISNRLRHLNI